MRILVNTDDLLFPLQATERYSSSIDRSETHSSSHNPRIGLSTSRSTVLPGLLCPVPV